MAFRALLVPAVVSVCVLVAGPASAHARLVTSDPVAGATVAAPKAIRLTFNEKLAPAFSSFDLAMADGMTAPLKISVSQDRKTMTGVPKGRLMAGIYRVAWRAASADDGHRMDGAFTFTVK